MSSDTYAHPENGPGGDEGAQEWQRWRQERLRQVAAPYGQLSVTGTHWLDALPGSEGVIEGLPGRWAVVENGRAVELEAHVADGLAVDGELLVGRARLEEDAGPPVATRTSYGERRLRLMRREGRWAVRVFDPDSAARRAFTGIDTFAYDPSWILAGTFLPYPDGGRTLQVDGADGNERPLRLDGRLGFAGPDGTECLLHAGRTADGGLWAVFSDAAAGEAGYRFRYLLTDPPAAFGAVTADFNRALLPPSGFTDHYLSPLPPPGNALPFVVAAGEKGLSGH